METAVERPLPQTRVTMQMREVPIPVALRAVAKAVDMNILFNENIQGVISIDVKAVPWEQVFRSLLRSHGLSYAWEGDIIRIMTSQDVKYVEPYEIRVVPIDYADAELLRDNVMEILSKESAKAEGGEGGGANTPLGSVMVDKYTNSLIIKANRGDIKEIIPLIKALDKPTQQVLIESFIVEASSDAVQQLGVKWGGLLHDQNYYVYPGANSTGVWGNTLDGAGEEVTAGGFAPTAGFMGGADTGLQLGYALFEAGSHMLGLELQALQEEGQLNILSTPSITTLDNSAAIIESGAEIPFQTVDENGKIVIQWKKATLKLEVTPHIIDNSLMKLNILTKKDELDFTRTVLGNPTILTKNAETKVILKDGQTTVIGGLKKDKQQGSETGVPGLKDIPVLGWLFKGKGYDNEMEEVLIFITPHILGHRTAAAGPEVRWPVSEKDEEKSE